MAFTIQTFSTILKRLKDRVVSRTRLSDLVSTSDLFILLANIAREIEKVYLEMLKLLDMTDIDKCTGADLDEWGKRMNPDKITRQDPFTATSTVIFSRTGIVGAITISIGTQVKTLASETGEEYVFSTTAVGTIADGATTSAPVAILADDSGSDYNVAAGAIKAFVSKPSGVDAVTNPNKVTNGRDTETNDSYRSRMKSYMRSLPKSTPLAIEGGIYGVTDSTSGKSVLFVNVVEDEFNPGYFMVYIDDGNGTAESTSIRTAYPVQTPSGPATGGEVDIYLADKPIKDTSAFNLYINAILIASSDYDINWATGHVKLDPVVYPSGLTAGDVVTADCTYYTGLIAECQKVLDGDPADRTTYPGYRAAGNIGQVESPHIQYQGVTANVTVLDGYDQAAVIANVKSAIADYINNLNIGEDIIRSELIERIMAVPGVYDVQMTNPAGNRAIADYHLARTTTALLIVT